jgi:hypothetical protein
MKVGLREVIVLIAVIVSAITAYLKSKKETNKTPLEEYETDKRRIDEVLASHDIARNSGLLDELLPPADAGNPAGDMQPK